MMAAMPPCVAAHASCMKRPRWRTTFSPSSKLIAPAAVKRREFPQRQSRRGPKNQRRHPLFEQLERDPAHQENARLRMLGLRQLRFRPVEANGRQIVTERRIGAVEPRLGGGRTLRQILAHAHHLRALPCK